MQQFANALNSFDPISLGEMDNVKLLNRIDTKFIFTLSQFQEVLDKLKPYYYCLEISGNRFNKYKTLYFDTNDKHNFISHHNNRINRFKVRFRKYVDSDLCFLEVKVKNKKQRTIKSRVSTPDIENSLSEASRKFIYNIISSDNANRLMPLLWNEFSRITFVNKKEQERLTIDFNLEFLKYNEEENYREKVPVVVAEVKQGKFNIQSPFIKAIKKVGVRKGGFSKYCIGMLLTHKEEAIKYNAFKPKLLKLKKITDGIA